MKLSALASQYVSYKQGMGMRFNTEARTLRPTACMPTLLAQAR